MAEALKLYKSAHPTADHKVAFSKMARRWKLVKDHAGGARARAEKAVKTSTPRKSSPKAAKKRKSPKRK
jgi:hypothetical protein